LKILSGLKAACGEKNFFGLKYLHVWPAYLQPSCVYERLFGDRCFKKIFTRRKNKWITIPQTGGTKIAQFTVRPPTLLVRLQSQLIQVLNVPCRVWVTYNMSCNSIILNIKNKIISCFFFLRTYFATFSIFFCIFYILMCNYYCYFYYYCCCCCCYSILKRL